MLYLIETISKKYTHIMNTPWFDPNLSWIPGTLLGIISGLFGALVGTLMPLSRIKKKRIGIRFIQVTYLLLLTFSALMLILGGVALIAGQPYEVWYGLGLTGVIGSLIFGSIYSLIFRLPKQMEAEWQNEKKR